MAYSFSSIAQQKSNKLEQGRNTLKVIWGAGLEQVEGYKQLKEQNKFYLVRNAENSTHTVAYLHYRIKVYQAPNLLLLDKFYLDSTLNNEVLELLSNPKMQARIIISQIQYIENNRSIAPLPDILFHYKS